jgi:hypothetical protein
MESFLRLGVVISHELRRSRSQRGSGRNELLQAQLSRFDESPLPGKVALLARELKCQSIESASQLSRDVENLAAFGNDCVHDAPVLMTSAGAFLSTLRRSGRVPAFRIGPYATSSELPSCATKARGASRSDCRSSYESFPRLHEGIALAYEILGFARRSANQLLIGELVDRMAGGAWSTARPLAKAFEEGPRTTMNVPLKELHEFALDVNRRTMLKRL